MDVQGLNTLEEFRILTDSEVESLIKVIRRPRGTIADPAPGAAPDSRIPTPGVAVSLRAENNLKLACYFLRHKHKTSRTVNANDITLANVRALHDSKEWEDTQDNPSAPELTPRPDWPKVFEAIQEWLKSCLGVTKIPLAYVIRANEDVQPEAADPPDGYDSVQEEMIARAPILDPAGNHTATFLSDCQRVWEKIAEIMRDHDCWTYVRPAQRSRNGRLAYLGLYDHYLGENNVDTMSTRTESRLEKTTYSGEKRNWNFEKYVKVHADQHAILEGLVDYGYAGIDERSKVRHLLKGIRTDKLDTIKSTIMANAQYRSDLSACVNLFKTFLEQMENKAGTPNLQVAAIHQGSNDHYTDLNVEDRYYKKGRYDQLTGAQKKGLKVKREKRGHKPGRKDSTATKRGKVRGNKGKTKLQLSKRDISAIATAVAAVRHDGDAESSEESDEEIPIKPPAPKKVKLSSNRNNPALQRHNM